MHSLTLALDGGEWSALCTSHFTPRKRTPGQEAGWARKWRTDVMADLVAESFSLWSYN